MNDFFPDAHQETENRPSHLLILEDDEAHTDLVRRSFSPHRENVRLTFVRTLKEAQALIERDPPDLIIAEWLLPDGKGIQILPKKDGQVSIPLVIMTSHGNEQLAVEMLKAGAIDYIVKSEGMSRDLPHIAWRALSEWENTRRRMAAEDEVKETQKRLEDIVNFLPDAVFAIDKEGRVVAWNKAIEKMTGVPAEKMLGEANYKYSIPFYGERRPILIDLVFEDNKEIEKKYEYIRRKEDCIETEVFIPTIYGGKGAYLWGSALPLYDSAGERVGAIEAIRDITVRKWAEEALRDSEKTFKALSENASDGILVALPNGIHIYANRRAGEITGYSVAELLTTSIKDLAAPEEVSILLEKLKKRLTEEDFSQQYETTIIRKDGQSIPIELTAAKTAWYGQPADLVIIRDITERKQAEELLRRQNAIFEMLLNAPIDVLALLDRQGVIMSINREGSRRYGGAEKTIVGRCVYDLLPPDLAAARKTLIDRVFETGRPARFDDEHSGKYLDNAIYPVFNPDRTAVEYVAVFANDITEKKKAEYSLKESETRFRELFNNMNAGVAIYHVIDQGEDFIFKDINRAAERIDDVSRDEIIGHSVLEIFPGVKEFGLWEVFQRVWTTGIAECHPVSLYKDERREGWRENFVYKISSGEIVAVYEDVTAKKKADMALLEAREWLGIALRAARAGTWDWDFSTGNLTWSPEFFALFGLPSDAKASFETWLDVLHPDDREPAMAKINQAIEDHNNLWNEYRIILPDGQVRWIGAGGSTQYDQEDKPYRMSGVCIDITNRKEAEEALQESEERYRTVFENTGTAMVVVEESNIISLVNEEFARLSGFSKGDIEGKKIWTEFVVKEDLERMLAQHRLRRQNRENALTHYEFRFITKSGEIRNIYLSIEVIPGTKKSVASLLDITDRKRAEELYQTVFENMGTAMIIIEEDTTISRVNEETEHIWGYSREEIEDRVKWPTLVAEEDLEKLLGYHRLRRSDPDTVPSSYEFRFIHKNGELRDAALTAAMIPGTKKSVISLRDITEFKKTEKALKESEERYEEIITYSLDSISLVDVVEDGRFRLHYLNPVSEEIMGVSFTDVAGKYLEEIFPPDLSSSLVSRYRECTRRKSPLSYEEMQDRPDGKRYYSTTLIPLKMAEGEIHRIIGISHDITNRKLMESEILSLNTVLEQRIIDRTRALEETNIFLKNEIAQRQTAEEKLQASLEEKLILLKEVHHRVKNNLQIIVSLLNLQARYISDKETLAAIRESQNRVRAMALVHEKLYQTENLSQINLNEYLSYLGKSILQFYGAAARGIRFTTDIPEVNVNIDTAIPFGLVMNELLSNSIKYAFPGKRKGLVEISVRRDNHSLFIRFHDDGIGVPENLEWRNTQTLGLRLVQSLVMQLNGSIDLDRSHGTTFTIVIHEKE